MTLGRPLGCGGCCLVPVSLRKLHSATGRADWKKLTVLSPRFVLVDAVPDVWSGGFGATTGVVHRWDGVTDGTTRPPTQIWESPVQSTFPNSSTPYFAAFDGSGGIWVGGPAPQSGTLKNVWHYDSAGSLLFSDLWLTPLVTTADCVSLGVLSGGDVIAWIQNSSFGNQRLQRRTTSGATVWSVDLYTSTGGQTQSLRIDSSDNILIATDLGSAYRIQNRAASNGSLVWQAALHGTQILGMAVNPAGDILATNRNDLYLGGGTLGYAARTYDTSGNVLNSLTSIPANLSCGACCWDASDGTWIIAGPALTAGVAAAGGAMLRKYSADLSTQIWESVHLSPTDVCADGAGFVYVTNANSGAQRD